MALLGRGDAPQGSTTTYVRDDKGNVTSTTKDADGNTTGTSTTTRDPKTGDTTTTSKDADGNTTDTSTEKYQPKETSNGPADGNPAGSTTTTTNNKDGSYESTTKDKNGNVIRRAKGKKDARGRKISEKVKYINWNGRDSSIGGYSETEYGPDGKPTKRTEAGPDGKVVKEITYTYNSDGTVTIQEKDENGRALPPRTEKASMPSNGAASADGSLMVQGLVLPSRVCEKEAFTFAAQGAVNGEVVQIETLSGEVVAAHKADNYGRVIMEAGALLAGVYEVVKGSGPHAKNCGQLTVVPRPIGSLAPVQTEMVPMSLASSAPIRIGSSSSLAGHGFCPNASQMNVQLGDQNAVVLAATNRELKLAPVSAMPGMQSIKVLNLASGQTASSLAMCYSLAGKLSQERVPSGARTMLMVSLEPKNLKADVCASIASGPVDFGAGHQVSTSPVRNGIASFPLYSLPGSAGPFQVQFNLVSFANQDGGKSTWSNREDGSSALTEYDKDGHLVHEAKYDKNGNPTDDAKWEYDSRGRMRKKVSIHWNADGSTTSETKTWDEKNRPTSSSSESRDSDGSQTSGSRSSTTYSGDNDRTGSTTNEQYDPKSGAWK